MADSNDKVLPKDKQELPEGQIGVCDQSGSACGSGHVVRSPHERSRHQRHGQTNTNHDQLLLVSAPLIFSQHFTSVHFLLRKGQEVLVKFCRPTLKRKVDVISGAARRSC